MYVPRPWHWSGPIAIIMIGLYLHEQASKYYNIRFIWEVAVFVQLPFAIIACFAAAFLYKAGVAFQNYMTRTVEARQDRPTEPKPEFVPRINLGAQPAYTQVVQPVRFDMERQFAKTLLNMHDFKPNDEAVDLREGYWIKPNKFRTRDEFIPVLERWKAHGIIAKKDARRNATYRVLDWRAVQLVAEGTQLPPPPQ